MKLNALLFPALALLSLLPWAQQPELPPSPVGRPPFMWGVTLSDYQNDGATPSMDWYQLERSGKLPERSGHSADFRDNETADLDRAESLGLNAFCTSIEWARLEPRPGYFDPKEVAYLHHLFAAIHARGMTPVVTLHHFVSPEWIYKDDGDGLVAWENPRTVAAYVKYVAFVAKEFGAQIDYYLTINEPSTLIGGGYVLGWVQPHLTGVFPAYRAAQNIIAAHIGAYKAIHRLDPVAHVSLPEYNALVPVADGGVNYMPGEWLNFFLDKEDGWDGRPRSKYLDFVAVHYYGAVDTQAASTFPVEPYRWGVNPQDFATVLHSYYQTYHLPIMVTENGCATDNDTPRADGWSREAYLVQHIKVLEQVKAEGVPIMGYFYWTLTDNYEWGSFSPRFGLWRVDVLSGDLTRHATPLVAVYRNIIRHNGVTPALLAKFPPPATTTAALN
ncbi:MAG TPA: family 1 glycosylhydrolase [Oscillatoriaceae cyanobacterium]